MTTSIWKPFGIICRDVAPGHPCFLVVCPQRFEPQRDGANADHRPQNDILISPATYWEIAIKVSIGKFRLPGPFADFMEQQIAQNDLTVLPITVAHAAVVASLPFHHKDPFDRLLIAQSIEENIPVLSADRALDAYPVTRLW
jgi:PIN domain nuclease of toxin-antitoxin system